MGGCSCQERFPSSGSWVDVERHQNEGLLGHGGREGAKTRGKKRREWSWEKSRQDSQGSVARVYFYVLPPDNWHSATCQRRAKRRHISEFPESSAATVLDTVLITVYPHTTPWAQLPMYRCRPHHVCFTQKGSDHRAFL